MTRYFYLILLLVQITASSSVQAANYVRLATLTDFEPYLFPKPGAVEVGQEEIPPGSDSKVLQGYSWDVVRESYHAMGYTIILHVVPWARAVHYVDHGTVDLLFPANRTAKREIRYCFSRELVDQIDMVIYAPVRDLDLWQSESLAGKTIGHVRGWAYGRVWEGDATIRKEPADSINQSFQLLAQNKIDGVMGYRRPYDLVLEKNGQTKQFQIVRKLETTDEYMMGRREDSAAQQLIRVFDQGRELIRGQGILEQIEARW